MLSLYMVTQIAFYISVYENSCYFAMSSFLQHIPIKTIHYFNIPFAVRYFSTKNPCFLHLWFELNTGNSHKSFQTSALLFRFKFERHADPRFLNNICPQNTSETMLFAWEIHRRHSPFVSVLMQPYRDTVNISLGWFTFGDTSQWHKHLHTWT